MLVALIKYRMQIMLAALGMLLFIYGYQVADRKWELKITKQENEQLKAEINKRKIIEDQLTKERIKNEELDKAYEEAIKTDVNYKCLIPNSLRNYINSI
jgi:hypothetical protein